MSEYPLLTTYLKSNGPDQIQIDSFNEFVRSDLHDIIQQQKTVHVTASNSNKHHCYLTFQNIKTVVPEHQDKVEARARGLTFSFHVYVEIKHVWEVWSGDTQDTCIDKGEKMYQISLGELPLMVNSCLDNHPQTLEEGGGGYFIVQGSEKVIIGQERLACNRLYVSKQKDGALRGEIRSVLPVSDRTGAQINRWASYRCILYEESHTAHLLIKTPRFEQVPVIQAFRALGISEDRQFYNLLHHGVEDEQLKQHLNRFIVRALTEEQESGIVTETLVWERLKYICSWKLGQPKELFLRELFPHIVDPFGKACLLARWIQKFYSVQLNLCPEDDKDHYANKRIEMAGPLFATMFRSSFSRVCGLMVKTIQKHLVTTADIDIHRVFNTGLITKGFNKALKTGNWTDPLSFARTQVGVTQPVNRFNLISFVSQLRRVDSALIAQNKDIMPRRLHSSQHGFFCPSETPEGKSCGLTKIFSIAANITSGHGTASIKSFLSFHGVHPTQFSANVGACNEAQKYTWFFINGAWFGEIMTCKLPDILATMKQWRRCNRLDREMSIIYHKSEENVYLWTDIGRLYRPVQIFDRVVRSNNTINKSSWLNCLNQGLMDYIDAEEQTLIHLPQITKDMSMDGSDLENCANFSVVTHLELHESVLLGYSANFIPKANHNQAPRVTYQCLHWEEQVAMADGTFKKIKDIRANDIVLSFHTKSLFIQPSRVLHQFVQLTNKSMVNVTTSSQRMLTTTVDHLYWTNEGWKRADQLLHKQVVIFPQLHHTLDYATQDRQKVCFETVISVEPHSNDFKNKVADITVEHADQTFITASGFGVHNSAMSKQAIGAFSPAADRRMDNLSAHLCYPQRSLVNTVYDRHFAEHAPSGQTCIVAIAGITGFNQEDSLIVNKAAIDRGLFRSVSFKTVADVENCSSRATTKDHDETDAEQINQEERPSGFDTHQANQTDIESDGIIAVGARLRKPTSALLPSESTLIEKHIHLHQQDNDVSFKVNEPGSVVDQVQISENDTAERITKIRLRSTKIPEQGDKFSSRHGQKGTVGYMCADPTDMIFTKDGMVPDIIINPHAFPSRMTVGHILESLLGKAALLEGRCDIDGTAFANNTASQVAWAQRVLRANGFDQSGDEFMYNGHTGEKIRGSIFIGPVYYQRLKHMVANKAHARSRGPRQNLTRQPTEGRIKNGGLRTGEMEKDCLLSHGMAAMLKDRLLTNSDEYTVTTCDVCGLLCYPLKVDDQPAAPHCRACSNSLYVTERKMPYAMVLMIRELLSINVALRFQVK